MEITESVPISTYPLATRVRVDVDGVIVADTLHALELSETGYPPRLYIPRTDVLMQYLEPSDTSTHCPFKGDASYFHIQVAGTCYENAVWSYEHPLDGMTAIRGYLVFDSRYSQTCVES